MQEMTIDEMPVAFVGDDLTADELANYVHRAREKYGGRCKGISVTQDGEYVNIEYNLPPQRFNRLRRITGKPN